MKLRHKFSTVFILILFISSVFGFAQRAQEEKPVKIPDEVDKIIKSNLAARLASLDIPLSYIKTLYFPYQMDYFTCFFLKIKKKDLGYESPFSEEKKEKAKEGQEEEEQILSCNVDFFFRIYSLGKNGQVQSIQKEIYLPYADQAESGKYNPEEENFYSFGTIFPPGRYLLSAAAASLDLSKIGLIFQEFYLPSSADFEKNLGFTPLFFIKSLKRMPSPDSAINVYRDLFHYATLEIEPFFEHKFSLTEKLDIFYFILGGTPSGEGKFNFEVQYIYKKGEEEVIKFEPQLLENIPAPIVSIPLPLLFKEKELEPGEYILEINIKDKVGTKEGIEEINFVFK